MQSLWVRTLTFIDPVFEKIDLVSYNWMKIGLHKDQQSFVTRLRKHKQLRTAVRYAQIHPCPVVLIYSVGGLTSIYITRAM